MKYTIEDLKEEYKESKYMIIDYTSTFYGDDLLHRILFLSDKIVELTNKNIKLEEMLIE